MRLAIWSRSLNPYFNLALEEFLLQNRLVNQEILLLYQHSNAIVIGRHQNLYLECNLQQAIEHNTDMVRRFSGGGTVAHDAGCLLYSFITDRAKFKRNLFFDLLQTVLSKYSDQISVSPHGDIQRGQYKIGGSAYRIARNSAYHHGTILISSDLDRINKLITIDPLQMTIQTQSNDQNSTSIHVPSRRAIIGNLSSTTDISSVKQSLTMEFRPDQILNDHPLNEQIQSLMDRLKSPNWLHSPTNPFQYKNQ